MMVSAIAWGAFWFVVLTLLVFAVILCAPVILGVEFNTAKKPGFRVTMAICGGLLPAFSMNDKRSKAPAAAPKGPSERKKEKKRKRFNMAASAVDMARAAPRLISKVLARVKIETINSDISFGLPDPADTGAIYGALSPVTLLFNTASAVNITLRPVFNEALFKGRGRLAARFTPIALVPPMFGFGWAAFVSPRLSKAFK